MKVVVIGGGASGLVSSIEAKKNGCDVTVLEKQENLAKKILVTGNGRCNYWNEDFTNKHFYSTDGSFIEKVNTKENREEVLNFFKDIGIVPTIKNGYYYPMSMQAYSIRNALLNEAKCLGVEIRNNTCVKSVKKENNEFYIECLDNEIIKADKVILATGSNAYYKDKNLGYDICRKMGHNIIDVLPSLVQLVGQDNYFKDWMGVRNTSKVSLYVDNQLIKEELGEVMFTDYGLSGICIFNLSGIASRALHNNKEVKVIIDFLPSIEDVKEFLEERVKTLKDRSLEQFLEGILNYKLVKIVLNKSNLNKDKSWESLTEIEKDRLIENLTHFDVLIVGTKDFDNAQVCTGGVDTKEIDSLTMESKIVKGFYVVGELLDVDGECGGYNLGFAWISGLVAGRSVKNG